MRAPSGTSRKLRNALTKLRKAVTKLHNALTKLRNAMRKRYNPPDARLGRDERGADEKKETPATNRRNSPAARSMGR